MHRVLIALDGSAADARVIDLASTLLAGRALEIVLLHVMPVPPNDDRGWASTAVLEGFVDAETCGDEVAPLLEQLRAKLGDMGHDSRHGLRLVPRHLIHCGDLPSVIERCGIAQGRQDSLDLLAAYARRLRQRGIDAATMIRDSAIGHPADIVREAARHLGADLLIVGGHNLNQSWHVVDDPAYLPCPVLVVPATDDAVPGAESGAAGRAPVTLS